jgi:GAF domain-containing protein
MHVPIPIPVNEKKRLDALYQYAILDTLPEQAYDDIATLAAFICDTPISAISLLDSNRQWFKAKIGWEHAETPRTVALCAHTIVQPDILVVEDTQADSRFAEIKLLAAESKIRFYAGVPLVDPAGYALGALCVMDYKPRGLTVEQAAALRSLGRQVMRELEARRVSFELAERSRWLQAEAYIRQEAESQQQATVAELEGVMNLLSDLQGLLAICAQCKAIRDEETETWQPLESYISSHSSTHFSHGLCPDCLVALYPQLYGPQARAKAVGPPAPPAPTN